jgi:flagellar biosynthetic protein FliQ
MTIGRQALELTLLVSAPLLLTALVIGLVVSIFQAATQINEMTLSFIPKLIAMAAVALITGPWMLRTLVRFTHDLITGLPGAIK